EIDLFHRHQRMHQPLHPSRILAPLVPLVRHYLPGKTVFIRKPAAVHFLSATRRELFPVIIDLLLRLAVDHERDRCGELELRPAVQGHELLSIELERYRHHRALLPRRFLSGVMSHPFDLRILEHGDIKFRCLLGLIIEPQEWSDFLHPYDLAASSHLSTPRSRKLSESTPCRADSSRRNFSGDGIERRRINAQLLPVRPRILRALRE